MKFVSAIALLLAAANLSAAIGCNPESPTNTCISDCGTATGGCFHCSNAYCSHISGQDINSGKCVCGKCVKGC